MLTPRLEAGSGQRTAACALALAGSSSLLRLVGLSLPLRLARYAYGVAKTTKGP